MICYICLLYCNQRFSLPLKYIHATYDACLLNKSIQIHSSSVVSLTIAGAKKLSFVKFLRIPKHINLFLIIMDRLRFSLVKQYLPVRAFLLIEKHLSTSAVDNLLWYKESASLLNFGYLYWLSSQ